MAIEIVDFSIKNGGSFQFAMLNYQRVNTIPFHWNPWFRIGSINELRSQPLEVFLHQISQGGLDHYRYLGHYKHLCWLNVQGIWMNYMSWNALLIELIVFVSWPFLLLTINGHPTFGTRGYPTAPRHGARQPAEGALRGVPEALWGPAAADGPGGSWRSPWTGNGDGYPAWETLT